MALDNTTPQALESSKHALVRRFGAHSTSFQALGPGFSWWHLDADAGVAYVDTGAAWVAAGAPLCAQARQQSVAASFVSAARQHKRRAIFFAGPPHLFDAAGGRSLVVGQEPLYTAASWAQHRKKNATIRQQLRRAYNKNVRVRRVDARAFEAVGSPLRAHIEKVMARWSGAHAMPPMGFLVDLNPFDHASERQFWLAEVHNDADATRRIVGFAAVIPIMATGGAMLEHLLRDPDAPNGCAEALIDAVLTDLDALPIVSLGMVPLHHVTHPLLRAALWGGEGLYHFGGLARFKAKLAPVRWEDVHVVWPRSQWMLSALYDILCAFMPQGVWRFVRGIVGRGSSALLRVLAWVLVPWTIALASMEGDVWFPTKSLQHFWTGFDVVLAIGLFRLSYRWQRSLATLLATLITCDAVATLVEACVYREPKGFVADIIRTVAVLAPAATAVVLWNARSYRARYRLKGQQPQPGKR